MAKIVEEVVVITISKLVKESDAQEEIVSYDTIAALTSVAEELLGNAVVVEVSKA
jgi:hypothetical protein